MTTIFDNAVPAMSTGAYLTSATVARLEVKDGHVRDIHKHIPELQKIPENQLR